MLRQQVEFCKTWLDVNLVIPKRIRTDVDKEGLVVMLGNTKGTLQRNIIEPLQRNFGSALVKSINSQNISKMFGVDVYCLGADKKTQVDKLRGSTIKYCYADELGTFDEDVFNILLSRLRTPISMLESTLNPLTPNHFIEKFIARDNPDTYCQHYTLYDNPFLPESTVRSLERAYPVGSVWHTRLILGMPCAGEGIVFTQFANDPNSFIKPVFCKKTGKIERFSEVIVAIDIGDQKSSHALCATGIGTNWKTVHAIKSERHSAKDTTPEHIEKLLLNFVDNVMRTYGDVRCIFFDGAQYMGRHLQMAVRKKYPLLPVKYAKKPKVIDRIQALTSLMGLGRFHMTDDCESLKDSLCQVVWHPTKPDEILDDYSVPIDDFDCFCYSFSHRLTNFLT